MIQRLNNTTVAATAAVDGWMDSEKLVADVVAAGRGPDRGRTPNNLTKRNRTGDNRAIHGVRKRHMLDKQNLNAINAPCEGHSNWRGAT